MDVGKDQAHDDHLAAVPWDTKARNASPHRHAVQQVDDDAEQSQPDQQQKKVARGMPQSGARAQQQNGDGKRDDKTHGRAEDELSNIDRAQTETRDDVEGLHQSLTHLFLDHQAVVEQEEAEHQRPDAVGRAAVTACQGGQHEPNAQLLGVLE